MTCVVTERSFHVPQYPWRSSRCIVRRACCAAGMYVESAERGTGTIAGAPLDASQRFLPHEYTGAVLVRCQLREKPARPLASSRRLPAAWWSSRPSVGWRAGCCTNVARRKKRVLRGLWEKGSTASSRNGFHLGCLLPPSHTRWSSSQRKKEPPCDAQ